MFKMFVFDMDGTITQSRGEIEPEMVELLKNLLRKYKVGIVSGGDFERFQIQVLQFFKGEEDLFNNLYIGPTQGGKMYVYKNGDWEKIYSLDFTEKEKKHIFKVVENAVDKLGIRQEKIYGKLIDDRQTLICYNPLGQEADQKLKKAFDPDFEKRRKVKDFIKDDLEGYDIHIAGSCSMDIIKKGIDKGYCVKKMMEITGLNNNQILFVGDRVFSGGNDFPPLENFGITTKKVFSLDDTKEFIKEMLK